MNKNRLSLDIQSIEFVYIYKYTFCTKSSHNTFCNYIKTVFFAQLKHDIPINLNHSVFIG